MSTARHVRAANRWRDQYNPLRALTIRRVASLLEAGERGEYADLQWLYRFIEKRHPTVLAARKRRLSAIGKLDWTIKVREDVANSPAAKAQKEYLRAAYERIDNLRAAIKFLAGATFRGYAHLEKHYAADGGIFHLEPVPQWYWVRDGINGDWRYNAQARSGTIDGLEIDPVDFLMREEETPVNEIAALAFVRCGMSQKDWDGFVESYGLPPLFIEMPANVPKEKEAEYQATAEAVIGDARGTMPNGAKIHTVDAGSRGVNPFESHIRYQDECIVLAATGGKLTMLTESGSGTLAGGAHSDTFDAIAAEEAGEISEIFQQQFDKLLLAQKFPGQPVCAYFEITASENIKEVVEEAKGTKQAGLQMDPKQFTEKTGIEVSVSPADSRVPSGDPFTNSNRQPDVGAAASLDYINASLEKLDKARLAALQPVIARLNELIDGPDEKFLPGLQQLIKDLPELGKKAGADEKFIEEWSAVLGGALANGLTAEQPPKTEKK